MRTSRRGRQLAPRGTRLAKWTVARSCQKTRQLVEDTLEALMCTDANSTVILNRHATLCLVVNTGAVPSTLGARSGGTWLLPTTGHLASLSDAEKLL
jgi:hypothetical protein